MFAFLFVCAVVTTFLGFNVDLQICSREGHSACMRTDTSAHCVFVMRANACVWHVCAFSHCLAASAGVVLSPHGEGTAPIPKQPPCVAYGYVASPGAPMGGAPTPNVEIPLERSQAVRPTVLISGVAPL